MLEYALAIQIYQKPVLDSQKAVQNLLNTPQIVASAGPPKPLPLELRITNQSSRYTPNQVKEALSKPYLDMEKDGYDKTYEDLAERGNIVKTALITLTRKELFQLKGKESNE